MASKMEEILEQLQQVNNDLEQSIKEKNVRWRVVNGNRVKKGTIVIDDNQIQEAKDLLDNIIKDDINGRFIKTEEQLSKIKENIEKIYKTLENMKENDELKKDKNKEALVQGILKMVKPVQTDLTKKKKAIEEYVNKEYDINEHIMYEEKQIDRLEKSNAAINEKFGILGMVENLFEEEFNSYNNISEKEEKIQEIVDLYKELKELNDNVKKEKDIDKKAKLTEEIRVKRTKIIKAQEQYKIKFADSVDFPKDDDEMDNKGLRKVNAISKKIDGEKKKVRREFFEKMRNISSEEVKLLEEFCAKFKVDKSDIIGRTNIELVYKTLSGKGEELLNKKMLNEQKIVKRKQTMEIIKKIDKAKTKFDIIKNEKDEDILKQDRAIIEVKKAVNNELEKFNLLMETSKIKRKDLRKALKSSVYKGKRFASICSFFASIRKKKALSKVENSYRQTASKKYIKNVRESVEKEYNEEMDKKKNFAEKYKVIGIEKTLSGKTSSKAATFEELDEELDK